MRSVHTDMSLCAQPTAGVRFWRRRGLRFLVFVPLLLVACFGDETIGVGADEPTIPSPTVLVSDTDHLTGSPRVEGDAPTPPGSVPLQDLMPTPTSAPMPDTAGPVVQPDTVVAVQIGAHVRVAGTGWAIAFREVVEDSRCPVDVQCIWAGQVTVRLVGEHTDGRVAALLLTMPAGTSGSGVLGDLLVEGIDVAPARIAGAAQPSSYLLRIRLRTAPAPDPVGLSGVRGLVTIGPMCPVMRADQPCPDQPYQATLVVRDASGREVARVQSSGDGAYALPLPPGTYVMDPLTPSASRLPIASRRTFEVTASTWTVLDISFDSGIR